MKLLANYVEDIKAAEDLLIKAKEEYREAIIQAVESDKLEESVYAEWRSIYYISKSTYYCTNCRAINDFLYDRCPCCGAHMTNSRMVYKYVTLENTNISDNAVEVEKKESVKKSRKNVNNKDIANLKNIDTASIEINLKIPRNLPLTDAEIEKINYTSHIIKELKLSGLTGVDISALLECDNSNISSWFYKRSIISDRYYEKLKKLSQEVLNEEKEKDNGEI